MQLITIVWPWIVSSFFSLKFALIRWPYFCPFFAFELGFVYYRLKIFSLIFSQLRSNVKIYLHMNFARRKLAKQLGTYPTFFTHSINTFMSTSILSKGDTNAKTKKNVRATLILYLAPLYQNSFGINLCPKATAGCGAACLFTSGRGAFANVISARIRKTEMMLSDRRGFLKIVADEINRSARKKDVLAVRLNGTSDYKLVELLLMDYAIASNVIFYDYTKIRSKAGRRKMKSGHDYVVTFSRAESNHEETMDVLRNDGLASVVFRGDLPETWNGYKVYDGDLRDDLMIDIKGPAVLGLRAKGKAKKDTTGFVVG